MSFKAPKLPDAPPPPPPPPAPPLLADASVQQAGLKARNAAASAAGGGFNDTLKTGPEGAPSPQTTTGGKALLGQ